MDISKEQWVVNCENGTHVVSLNYSDSNNATLFVDDKVIDNVKVNHFFNFEYKFKVEEQECSIVKLVTDKTFGFVVNSEYQNKSRKYNPITNIPVLTWIALFADLIAFIGFIVFTFSVDLSLRNKMFCIMLFMISTLVTTYFIRVICNSPCVIKNHTQNLLFRSSLIIIIEIAYSFISLGLFDMVNFG